MRFHFTGGGSISREENCYFSGQTVFGNFWRTVEIESKRDPAAGRWWGFVKFYGVTNGTKSFDWRDSRLTEPQATWCWGGFGNMDGPRGVIEIRNIRIESFDP